MKNLAKFPSIIFLLALLIGGIFGRATFGFANGQNASIVIGQQDFATGKPGNTECSPPRPVNGICIADGALGLSDPQKTASDSHGNLWVVDTGGNRVLEFKPPFYSGMTPSVTIGAQNSSEFGTGLSAPRAATFDVNGDLWVADTGNRRVAEFRPPFANGARSSLILTHFALFGPGGLTFDSSGDLWVVDGGQFPGSLFEFKPPYANDTAFQFENPKLPCQQSYCQSFAPAADVFDSSGDLWLADPSTNRVLEFKPPFIYGESPSTVLGQQNLTTTAPSASQTGLSGPEQITTDSLGDFWVADTGNNRVVEFKPPFTNGTSESIVIGQSNFTSNTYGSSQSGLSYPVGVTFDPFGDLWVADRSNSRVVAFTPTLTDGESASVEISQWLLPTRNGLDDPTGTTLDSQGNLWLSDSFNNRVLEFARPYYNDQNASIVIGQPGFSVNNLNTSRNGLDLPSSIALDPGGNLWVVDSDNSRILQFKPPFTNGISASLVLGQTNFTSNSPSTSQNGLAYPGGAVFDSSGNLWVADTGNSRILEYVPPFTNDQSASVVVGQQIFTTDIQATSESAMNTSIAITFDHSGNLWVSDSGNSRVLKFGPPFTSGMSASLVIGQPGFTTSTSASSQNKLAFPGGIAFDSHGNLWVVDSANSRVLDFSPPFTSSQAASLVVGQLTFDTNAPDTSQRGLGYPSGITFDSYGNMWVVDTGNNRVLEFLAITTIPPSASDLTRILLALLSYLGYAATVATAIAVVAVLLIIKITKSKVEERNSDEDREKEKSWIDKWLQR